MRLPPILALALLALPVAAQTPTPVPDPPLVAAVKAADLDGLKAALAAGAAVGDKDQYGWTAVMWAVGHADAATVQVLLDKGADLRSGLPAGYSPMVEAAKGGRGDVIPLLAKAGFGCSAKDAQGVPALAYATAHANTMAAAALLACKADVDARDPKGFTPLIRASQQGAAKMVAFLLSNGAAVDAKDNGGYTALMWASHAGSADAVKALLAANANPRVTGKDGRTAAAIAKARRRTDVSSLLPAP